MSSKLGDSSSKPFASAFDKAKKRKRSDATGSAKQGSNNKEHKPKKKKQRPPKRKEGTGAPINAKKKILSRAALDLSEQLKECSKNKDLEEALVLFWDKRKDGVLRDQFHASITIDCCARCGALEEITRILQSLKEPTSVETNTTAIKGYSHGGDIRTAFLLFESMWDRKIKQRPNIRTLNTLLRGCLWTASTLNSVDHIFGGVVTSERAWSLYETKSNEEITSPPSYEYSINLLCQALRTEEAEKRINKFQMVCGVKTAKHVKGGDQSTLETFAVSYAALARAKALLGDKKGALDACELSRRMVKASAKRQSVEQSTGCHNKGAVGGTKRAWKENNDDRRTTSNTMFRDHRMSELEINLQSLVEVCQSERFPPAKDLLAKRIVNGLFYFSGGGTTQMNGDSESKACNETSSSNTINARALRRQVINSSWLSFGLQPAVIKSETEAKLSSDFLRVKDAERIYREVGKNPKAIQDDACIDFSVIFPNTQQSTDIELGSGYGEWMVNQAASLPDRNHVAVELRADRVHQIFAKGMLIPAGPLENLAVVGDDCSSFLLERVKPQAVSTIFANHPEPPTQVHGKSDRDLQTIMDGGPEPGHMLSSRCLIAAGKVLEKKGRMVIVTDNMNYARLLCATVVRINRQKLSCLRSCGAKPKALGLREIESFPLNESKAGNGRVVLLEGQPSPKIGHAGSKGSEKGSSYFDRLWRTGACGHASSRERYILILEQHEP